MKKFSDIDSVMLVLIKFSKSTEKIDVAVSNSEIRQCLMENDEYLSNFIGNIKELIPEKFLNKELKLSVKLNINKRNEPYIVTNLKYPFRLGKYLGQYCNITLNELNEYFSSVIKVSLSRMDAKNLKTVNSQL